MSADALPNECGCTYEKHGETTWGNVNEDGLMFAQGEQVSSRVLPVIAIHGGAGAISRAAITPEQRNAYLKALEDVVRAGQALLAQGASAFDTVVEAVRLLEECPLFNAGYGAVYTADGRHELDACVMRGEDRAVGAVAGVRHLRNPVLAAREVLLSGGPVFLIGEGAETFAFERGLERVAPEWFDTPWRLEQLVSVRAAARGQMLDHDVEGLSAPLAQRANAPLDERNKFGTVGAVALDVHGHLAAASSTGGLTNKLPGRVGDSPLAGAGTYANDRTVAVACTGVGEAFIRGMAAYEISALVEYAGLSLEAAARRVVQEKLPPLGGHGGLVAVDAHGNVTLPFNTEGMYRGWARVGQSPVCAIHAEDEV